LDSHSFPLRIVEVADHPYRGVLQVGYCGLHLLEESRGSDPEWLVVRASPVPGRIRQLRSTQPGEAESIAAHPGVGRDHLLHPRGILGARMAVTRVTDRSCTPVLATPGILR
jgi:hypothetical protein